jgi:hypothetical protein
VREKSAKYGKPAESRGDLRRATQAACQVARPNIWSHNPKILTREKIVAIQPAAQ